MAQTLGCLITAEFQDGISESSTFQVVGFTGPEIVVGAIITDGTPLCLLFLGAFPETFLVKFMSSGVVVFGSFHKCNVALEFF